MYACVCGDIVTRPPLDAEPNSKPRIRAATLPKLIEKLTYPKYPGTYLQHNLNN
jgi:hypothetical protein